MYNAIILIERVCNNGLNTNKESPNSLSISIGLEVKSEKLSFQLLHFLNMIVRTRGRILILKQLYFKKQSKTFRLGWNDGQTN
jgi:hypothetical protein